MAGLAEQSQALRSFAPPSVLPDISPTWPNGEIRPAAWVSPIGNADTRAAALKLPISPWPWEMSGRTEGGAKERCFTERVNSQRHSADCHPGSAP